MPGGFRACNGAMEAADQAGRVGDQLEPLQLQEAGFGDGLGNDMADSLAKRASREAALPVWAPALPCNDAVELLDPAGAPVLDVLSAFPVAWWQRQRRSFTPRDTPTPQRDVPRRHRLRLACLAHHLQAAVLPLSSVPQPRAPGCGGVGGTDPQWFPGYSSLPPRLPLRRICYLPVL